MIYIFNTITEDVFSLGVFLFCVIGMTVGITTSIYDLKE